MPQQITELDCAEPNQGLLHQIVRGKNKENRQTLTDSLPLFGTCVHCLVSLRSTSFQKVAVFPFSGKAAPNVMDHLRLIHTYFAIPMPFPCHAMPLRV
jgi:hypothetical protein